MSYRLIKALKILIIFFSVSVILASAYYVIRESDIEILKRLDPINMVESTTDFEITIPKIELQKTVIPNVDPRDENIYKEAFKQGVAHGLGTKFPDEIGNTYLYAHSTKKVEDIEKNAGWFTRIDELEIGDEIVINYGQNKYIYSIASREIVDPRATGVYTSYAPVQMLTLQTCYPRGEITERIIYKALLVEATPLVEESFSKLELFPSLKSYTKASILPAFLGSRNRDRRPYC